MSGNKRLEIINEERAERIDREFRALLARVSRGMSPLQLGLATMDWVSHLAISPGTQLQLVQSFISKLAELGLYSVESLFNSNATGPASMIERRMSSEAWQKWPFKVLAQAHQTSKDWIEEAVIGVEGVHTDHEILVHAVAEHIADQLSPANFPLTNPEVLAATRKEFGKNLLRGARFFVVDQARRIARKDPPPSKAFKVGENLAATPGKVVFQNSLIELIQYEPVTEDVGAEPVLISPAWIMKYYILDLSPKNSLVKYLTEQGKTVFIISWKNPDTEDSSVGFEDYVQDGLMQAIDAVSAICPQRKIHAVGYCIGGTLLSITAAAMAREDDDRLQSITLFAAQTDFSEAGEVTRYISHSQLSFLEKVMWKRGYLTSENMGSTFASLRASDLVHAAMVDRYLLGKTAPDNDLMFWNSDGTRMPHLMHSQYLKQLYLKNMLATNRFCVGGKPVSMSDVRVPMYVLGTETDHVAPWKSVFKIHQLTQCELTFTLTSGGHNAGVVSGPQHPRRRFRVHTRLPGDKFIDPDTWMESMPVEAGSWWPHWNQWLDHRMTSQIKAPAVGAPAEGYQALREAPGEYIFG